MEIPDNLDQPIPGPGKEDELDPEFAGQEAKRLFGLEQQIIEKAKKIKLSPPEYMEDLTNNGTLLVNNPEDGSVLIDVDLISADNNEEFLQRLLGIGLDSPPPFNSGVIESFGLSIMEPDQLKAIEQYPIKPIFQLKVVRSLEENSPKFEEGYYFDDQGNYLKLSNQEGDAIEPIAMTAGDFELATAFIKTIEYEVDNPLGKFISDDHDFDL